MTVPEGTAVTMEGEHDHAFYVIAEGDAEVSIHGKHVAMLRPGEFFGEMALLDPARRVATVTATSPLTLYRVEGEDFRRLLIDVPFITRSILRGLAHRLRVVEEATF
jgi:CRP/FNR family transcriptional regulator, cyclic AMP receptor protein